jgi:hypothetical protein
MMTEAEHRGVEGEPACFCSLPFCSHFIGIYNCRKAVAKPVHRVTDLVVRCVSSCWCWTSQLICLRIGEAPKTGLR